MRRPIITLTGLTLLAIAVGIGWHTLSAQEEPRIDPNTLLPTNTLVYLAIHGEPEVQEAWKKSAAYRAVVQSGLSESLHATIHAAIPSIAQMADMPTTSDRWISLVEDVAQHATQHGMVFAADVRLLAGEFTLVLADAANAGLDKSIDEAVRTLLAESGIEVTNDQIEGRNVATAKVDPFFLVWWTEGSHLVIAGNQLGPNPILRRAAGKSDNLTDTERYTKFHPTRSFVTSGEFWVDIPPLLKLIPQAAFPKLPEFLEGTGLQGLEGVRVAWGYEGEAMRTDYDVLLPAPRHGLFASFDQGELALDQLPKIPHDTDFVHAAHIDWTRVFDSVFEFLSSLSQIDPMFSFELMQQQIQQFEKSSGIQIRDQLVASLGTETVVYSSPSDGPFGILGISAAIAVKDRGQLEAALDKVAESIRNLDAAILLEKQESDGTSYWFGGYKTEFFPFAPTLALTDKWLFVTPMTPAPAVRFVQLQSAQGPAWSASTEAQKLPTHSGKVVGFSYSNPKPTVQLAASILPVVLTTMRNTMSDFQFDMTKIPNIDMILDSTFPGIAVMTVDDAGWHVSSRYSLPLTGPELGLSSLNGNSATVGIAVALILPAIQAARDSATGMQGMNHQKQIGLALHMMESETRTLPRGTSEQAENLPVDQRLSWMASLVPFLDPDQQVDFQFDKPWNDPANREDSDRSIPTYLNPSLGDRNTNRTHYVGMAGVGDNAAKLEKNDPKAGIFGYNRKTTSAEIRDGAAHTIAVIGVHENIGPWAQGGPSTVRGLSQEPYIGGPDGFGGHPSGVTVLMADGSVRVLSKDIDPAVLEALATKSGAEQIELP